MSFSHHSQRTPQIRRKCSICIFLVKHGAIKFQRVKVLPSRASINPCSWLPSQGDFWTLPHLCPQVGSGLRRIQEWGTKRPWAHQANHTADKSGRQQGEGDPGSPVCPPQSNPGPLSSPSTIENTLSCPATNISRVWTRCQAICLAFYSPFLGEHPQPTDEEGLINSHFVDVETGPQIVKRARLSVPKLVSSRARTGPWPGGFRAPPLPCRFSSLAEIPSLAHWVPHTCNWILFPRSLPASQLPASPGNRSNARVSGHAP